MLNSVKHAIYFVQYVAHIKMIYYFCKVIKTTNREVQASHKTQINMEKIKGNWGSIFKTAMENQNVSVTKMSTDLEISKRTIYSYLSDKVEPTVTPFLKITKYLKIEL